MELTSEFKPRRWKTVLHSTIKPILLVKNDLNQGSRVKYSDIRIKASLCVCTNMARMFHQTTIWYKVHHMLLAPRWLMIVDLVDLQSSKNDGCSQRFKMWNFWIYVGRAKTWVKLVPARPWRLILQVEKCYYLNLSWDAINELVFFGGVLQAGLSVWVVVGVARDFAWSILKARLVMKT